MPNPLCYLLLFFNFSNCSLVNPLRDCIIIIILSLSCFYIFIHLLIRGISKTKHSNTTTKRISAKFLYFLIVKRTINLKKISLCLTLTKYNKILLKRFLLFLLFYFIIYFLSRQMNPPFHLSAQNKHKKIIGKLWLN